MSAAKPYKLPKVAIRMVKEPPLYSAEPIRNPQDAVKLVQQMLEQYDREALVILNFDAHGKPINLNIVSLGSVDAAICHPREIMKSAILSNAASVMMLHNHPSGNIEPSPEDIKTTNNMYSLCKFMDIPLRDHIITGHNGQYYSFSEHGMFQTRGSALEELSRMASVCEKSAVPRKRQREKER